MLFRFIIFFWIFSTKHSCYLPGHSLMTICIGSLGGGSRLVQRYLLRNENSVECLGRVFHYDYVFYHLTLLSSSNNYYTYCALIRLAKLHEFMNCYFGTGCRRYPGHLVSIGLHAIRSVRLRVVIVINLCRRRKLIRWVF